MEFSALEVKNISFIYEGNVKVLDDVSFELRNEEILVVAGPNGSGKTTLIKLIFDLLEKQDGDILVNGKLNSSLEIKKKIMYLPSDNVLPDFLTGREYIDLMCRMYDNDQNEKILENLISYYSMDKDMDKLIESYSHGMVKKVELIAAFLIQPDIVVIDETLNGIDLEAKEVSKVLINKLKEKGKSVIVCTHDLDLAEEIGERAILLYKGKKYKEVNLEVQKSKSLTEIFREIIDFREDYYEIL